jgi:hypothetical protein
MEEEKDGYFPYPPEDAFLFSLSARPVMRKNIYKCQTQRQTYVGVLARFPCCCRPNRSILDRPALHTKRSAKMI